MESELSLEDMLETRCEVLDQLQLITAFIKSEKNLTDVLVLAREFVLDMSNKLCILRKHVDQLKKNSESHRNLLSLYQELDEKILHMYANVPEELIKAYKSDSNIVSTVNANASTSKDQHQNVSFNSVSNVEEPIIQDCKKALFNEPDYPKISLLTKGEFNGVPKYMIGRHSLNMVNNLVTSINQVLKAKYSLLSAGKAAARKNGELALYLNYKKQDIICESNGNTYFFTAEDYKNYTKVNLDKTTLQLMIVLRHCKRIREYRIKKELYYIIVI